MLRVLHETFWTLALFNYHDYIEKSWNKSGNIVEITKYLVSQRSRGWEKQSIIFYYNNEPEYLVRAYLTLIVFVCKIIVRSV